MRLRYNYHTHTFRCGHALGEDEEYVLAAIDNGFIEMGFSDHVMLRGYSQPGIRGEYYQLSDYLESVARLKEKYKDQIIIHVGFEAEYYPSMMDYYRELQEKWGIEYFILGQHCYLDENNKFKWYLGFDNREERVNHYVRDLIEGMSTGLFKYVAHPDLFVRLFMEDDPVIDRAARAIAEASVKYDVPLEINLSGVGPFYIQENNLHYPHPTFWKIVGEIGAKVVMSIDAHEPKNFYNSNYQYGFDLIDKYNLNFIENFKI